MKPTVFIHTNAKQIAGAIVARHALKRNSATPDAFDVAIIAQEDYDFFRAFEGQKFLRAGGFRTWRNDDLQSFTPTRFAAPELMGYRGRAVVIDPDIFAVGDICALLERDMGDKAVMARARKGHNGRADYIATSAMLLDCARLPHWNVARQFEAMFRGELDYDDWIVLANEPSATIGFLEPEWNDFDRLSPETKLLHNTKRRTQPWKTGLPIDFTNRIPLISRFLPENGVRLWGRYKAHPDPRQEAYFFALLKECLETGQVTEAEIEREMASDHLRHDALKLARRAKPVDAVLADVRLAA
jgi:hypothetical protein